MNHRICLSRRAFLACSAASVIAPRAAAAAGPSSSSPPAAKEPLRLTRGVMLWRIGDILDFDEQVAWVAEAGFESIGFHASRGTPGKWRGIDPEDADAARRRRVRKLISPFRQCEIHAPFEAELKANTPEKVLAKLEQVLRFAADVGVSVVTVHAVPPPLDVKGGADRWQRDLDRLDAAARKAEVRVGIELNRGFSWLRKPRREWIGVTLDVGHMYFDHRPGYRPWGTIGGQVHFLADLLFHLHLHDNTGTVDHIEIGTGKVDWRDLFESLAAIRYQGSMMLEMNPDRVTPEGIRRSGEYVAGRWPARGT
ncbi:MAG: sugar phosphate isomerase/epimerase family protein [Planctomycetota bacterium]